MNGDETNRSSTHESAQQKWTEMDHSHLRPLKAYRFSRLVAFLTDAVPNACFQNAWEVMSELPQWFVQGAYIEGWLVLEWEEKILVIEHGWTCLPDDQIVDPSIIFLVGGTTGLLPRCAL
jgi:hypothetical protein